MSPESEGGANQQRQDEQRRQQQARYCDFLACRWEAREDPAPGMVIKVDASRNEPLATPVARPVAETREEPTYVIVERQKKAEGPYVLPFGHIASDMYETFDEAFQAAADRNRDFLLSKEPLQNQSGEEVQAASEIHRELAMYAQAGLMFVLPEKAEAIVTLVHHWTQQGGVAEPEEHLVVVDEKATAAEVNQMCQLSRRTHDPERAYERVELTVRLRNSLYVGDRVVFGAGYDNESLRGRRGTVLPTAAAEKLVVKVDNREVVEIPAERVPAAIELGYAVTAEQARPYAAEHAYVLIERATHREQDVSYMHSHDPTNTAVFIGQQEAGLELAQIAERGIRHGEPIREWWKSQYLESQQSEPSRQISQQQSPDLSRDVM